MKSLIVFAMVVCVAVAASIPVAAGPDSTAQVLRNENDNIGVEGFRHASETSNGISQEAQGIVKNPGTESEALEVRGSFSYTGPDGLLYAVQYIANELGFQPQGSHLPVGPQV